MFKWLSSVNIKLGNNGQSGNLKITPTHKKNSFERIKAGALIWLNDPEYPTTVSRYDMGAANRNALNHSQTFDQSGLVEDDTACHTLVGNVYFEPVQEAIDLYILQVRY